jgi:hypothetical protein
MSYVDIPAESIRERKRESKNETLRPFIKTEKQEINAVYGRILNNRNVFYITHDKRKFEEMKNQNTEMEFVENSTIPAKTTKKGVEWLAIFEKIPVGKAWKPNTETYKIQSIRSARSELDKKGLLKHEITVTQRMENEKLVIYVSNTGLKKSAEPARKN